MSEMHCGYRSYRTSVLKQIPFTSNSLSFDFDADIIVQLHAAGCSIVEVPIPTYYGDEICRVNGMVYAWQCLKTTLKYRLMQLDLFYDPKFDMGQDPGRHYTTKHAPTSLHHFIRKLPLPRGTRLIDVGGGRGEAIARTLAEGGLEVTCLDRFADLADPLIKQFAADLDLPWDRVLPAGNQFDVALALDVLEHLAAPEQAATEIFQRLKSGGRLYASTGNVAFLPLRLALLCGWFNYGRRGILDLTHRRLFTLRSFQRLLKNAGFRIERVIGFGPPLQDLERVPSRFLILLDRTLSWLAKRWPSIFGYQILFECVRPESAANFTGQALASMNSTRNRGPDDLSKS
jgi:2-polyprenyl-3-methyl-5-hydroxy-6-metoxy-1,4-benzoquinol methylase